MCPVLCCAVAGACGRPHCCPALRCSPLQGRHTGVARPTAGAGTCAHAALPRGAGFCLPPFRVLRSSGLRLVVRWQHGPGRHLLLGAGRRPPALHNARSRGARLHPAALCSRTHWRLCPLSASSTRSGTRPCARPRHSSYARPGPPPVRCSGPRAPGSPASAVCRGGRRTSSSTSGGHSGSGRTT